MDPTEEAAWRVVVKNPLIRPKELADEANIPLSMAQSMLGRIGTPREVLRKMRQK